MNIWRFRLSSTIDALPPQSILDTIGYLSDSHLDIIQKKLKYGDINIIIEEIRKCRSTLQLAERHFTLVTLVLANPKVCAALSDFNVALLFSKIACLKSEGVAVSLEWIT